MSIRTTRVLLIRNLLRVADRRHLARVLDRVAAPDLDLMFAECSAHELRRGASVLFDSSRLQTSLTEHSDFGLRQLLQHATPDDARRALGVLSPKRAAELLLGIVRPEREVHLRHLDEATYAQIIKALPRRARPSKARTLRSVFRLSRLFA